ncbi:MAG: cell division protein FtsI, partial [Lachnospiraceae bacterium]|nr:cell division protein FtsI [Lachnospiraceae bacterium]
MQKKLVVLFVIVLLAFLGLSIQIYAISRDKGNEYSKTVLSQQSYDSRVIDFKRGSIIDAKGTVLADSELVYDVIVDAKQMLSKDYYLEPSLHALEELGIDAAAVRRYVTDNPSSQYYIVMKNLPYARKTAYDERLRVGREQEEANGTPVKDRIYSNVKGIWFDANYIRNYPNGSLGCDVIGFTNGSNQGQFGLEEYYNDTLNGTPGREYGYLDEMSNLERTTIDATDGYNLITTIDANIQSIIEKYLKQFNDEHANTVHIGNGANNVGCIVMNVKTGEILGMGTYPGFDLNNPYSIASVAGMPKLNEKDAPSGEYLTAEDVNAMSAEDQTRYLNALWRNFCISDYYEPGSVAKPFTVAAALESGSITGNEYYDCQGHLD